MSDPNPAPRAPLVATPMRNGALAIVPRSFEEVWRYSTMLAAAGEMVPECYRGKPEACALAVMWAMELGISPIQAVQGIAPIKGRPAVWGDLALALTMQHPDYEDLLEEPMHDAAGVVMGYRATAKRKGREPKVREFTIADAAKAGLIKRAQEKGGPWRDYPQRMCQMRARSWAIRDQFPDALRGLYTAEEAIDIPDTDYTVVQRAPVDPIQQPQPRAEAKPAAEPASEPEAKPEVAALEPPAPNPLDELATQQVQGAVDFSDLDELPPKEETRGPAPKRAQAAQEALSGDLLPRDDAPPGGDRGELGKAQASTLNAYLQTLEGIGVMEQELFDELGDSVHAGNFDAAIRWCEARLKRGRA